MLVLLFSLYLLVFSGCLSPERLEEVQAPQQPALLSQAALPTKTTPEASTESVPAKGSGPSSEALFNFCAGYHALLDGHWDKAALYFEKALEKDPDSERILRYIVGCYMQMGKREKSLAYLEKLSKVSPDDFRVHYSLGDFYQREGRVEEATLAFEKATRSNLSNEDPSLMADVLYRLANLYLQKQEPAKAIPCLKDIFKLNVPVNESLVFSKLGIAYAETKDFLNAKEMLEKAKALNPSLGQARIYLATVYEATGELQKAIKESEDLLEISPEAWIVYAYLAGLYKKASRIEEAEFLQEKAITLLTDRVGRGSNEPREHLALAQLLIAKQRRKEAQKVLENAVKVIEEEKSKDLRFLLASLYYEANCEEAVEKELKYILRIDPDSHAASNFLGYFYAERGKQLGEALKLVEKALQAEPNNGAYIDSLGWVYYKQATENQDDTRLEQALQRLLEASDESPDPEIFRHVGEVYFSLGQWEAASTQWQRALKLQPKGPKDEQILLWIQEKLKKLDALEESEKELLEEYPGS